MQGPSPGRGKEGSWPGSKGAKRAQGSTRENTEIPSECSESHSWTGTQLNRHTACTGIQLDRCTASTGAQLDGRTACTGTQLHGRKAGRVQSWMGAELNRRTACTSVQLAQAYSWTGAQLHRHTAGQMHSLHKHIAAQAQKPELFHYLQASFSLWQGCLFGDKIAYKCSERLLPDRDALFLWKVDCTHRLPSHISFPTHRALEVRRAGLL